MGISVSSAGWLTSFYKVFNKHLEIPWSYHPDPAQGLQVTRGHDKCLQRYLTKVDAFKYSFHRQTLVDSNQLLAETVHAESIEAVKLRLLLKTVASAQHMYIALHIAF